MAKKATKLASHRVGMNFSKAYNKFVDYCVPMVLASMFYITRVAMSLKVRLLSIVQTRSGMDWLILSAMSCIGSSKVIQM